METPPMNPDARPQTDTDTWFRTTLYSIGDAVITVDINGQILQMNHVAEQLTGWNESEASGRKIGEVFRIVNEETRVPVENPVDIVFREGAVVGLTNFTLLISKNGIETPIADSGAPIRNDKGEIMGAVLVFRDQSLERETKKRIIESERRLSTLISNMPGIAYRCRNDRKWTMEFISEGCFELTGFQPDDIIENKNISYNSIIHPDDRETIWEMWQEVIQSNSRFEGEYRIVTKDKKIKWVWEQGQGVVNEKGEVIALEGFITDITENKNMVDALRYSQKMLQTILDTIPVRVFWKDGEGKYLGCNKPFALDAGFSSPDDIIGKDDYHMGWIDQAELYRADDRIVIDTGIPRLGYEEPQTAPDGKERWLRTSKVPLRDTGGTTFGVLGTYEDITGYKQAEELLRRSESLFRTVWEESLDGMRLTDSDGIVVRVNEAYSRMVEMPKEQIEGNPLSIVYAEDQRDHILRRHKSRFNARTVAPSIEKELILHNGKKIWFEVSNSYFEQNGKQTLLLGVFRDISKRVGAENALRESEQKYRTLFEESKDTIYITSPGGKILDINPAGVELLGYSSKEELLAIDVTSDLYVNPIDRRGYIETLHRNGFVKDYEINLKRKDGRKITVLETATVVRDKNRKPVIYRGILRDITQQRMLEAQLRHAQKMESIGTLAGGIAHDFNNILSIILGHASLLKINKANPEKVDHGINTIQKAVQRGASLVQQLLTFARKADVHYELININDTIQEIQQFLHETFPKNIEVNIGLQEKLPTVYADSTQIHQILLNLSLNARDAMQKGGTLSITTEVIDGSLLQSKFLTDHFDTFIHLMVSDTGTGMDKRTLERVFDPFFTTKEPGKGSGLGLAVVYSIVESYNGIINIDSSPGHGTTINIYFPVTHNELTNIIQLDAEANHEDLTGTEKVLIIEDEEPLIDSLKAILIKNGYSVITARDGEEGVHIFSHNAHDMFGGKIDIVISDLGMPKLTGDEVLKKMKKIDREVKFILASGFIDPDRKKELTRAGAKYFIKKPYIPDQVIRLIRSILDSGKK